jgi:hypothetical protein
MSRRDPAVPGSARRVRLRARKTNSARSNICRPPVCCCTPHRARPCRSRSPTGRAYGLVRDPAVGRHAISLIGPGPDFSPQYAMTTDPDEPAILATLAGPGGELGGPLLIDGYVLPVIPHLVLGVDSAVAVLFSSMRWVIGGAGCPGIGRAARWVWGSLGPARFSCRQGPQGSPGSRPACWAVAAGDAPAALRPGGGPVPCARRVPRPERFLEGERRRSRLFSWSWRPRGGGGGLVLAGATPGTVALAVQQQVVAGVEDPVQDGLADDRVGEQRVPVGRGPVAGQDQRPSGAADPADRPRRHELANSPPRHCHCPGCGGKRGGDSRAGGRLSPGPAGPPRAANRLRGEEASEEPLGIREVAAVYLHPEPGKGLPHGDVQAVPGAAGDPRLQSPKSYAVVNKDPAEVAFG